MVEALALTASRVYSWHRRRLLLWLPLFAGVVIVSLAAAQWASRLPGETQLTELAPVALIGVLCLALLCEYMDSSLGMGYGTTLTPILLIVGFDPLTIVPAVLFSELLTGAAAGVLHHHDGNLDLTRDPQARRTLALLAALSGVGALAAVLLAVRLPGPWLGYCIVGIVLSMSVVTLATARRRVSYRAGGIVAVGLVAAFNKGLSGGGYGPLVTAGQVVSGVHARQAVAITSLAEALTCLIGFLAYLVAKGPPDWGVTLLLTSGALLSVPWATATIRHLPESTIRRLVGLLTLVLGLVSLAKLTG